MTQWTHWTPEAGMGHQDVHLLRRSLRPGLGCWSLTTLEVTVEAARIGQTKLFDSEGIQKMNDFLSENSRVTKNRSRLYKMNQNRHLSMHNFSDTLYHMFLPQDKDTEILLSAFRRKSELKQETDGKIYCISLFMEKGSRYRMTDSVMEYSNGLLKLPLLKKLQVA